eukprot:scaffold50276_cov62-Phaeocystis_antarctica.AAC.1
MAHAQAAGGECLGRWVRRRWLSAAQRTVVAAVESWFKVFSTGQIRLHDLKRSQSMTGGDKTWERNKKKGMQSVPAALRRRRPGHGAAGGVCGAAEGARAADGGARARL